MRVRSLISEEELGIQQYAYVRFRTLHSDILVDRLKLASMIALFVQLVLALIVFHPAPVGGGASVSPRRTSAGTCPRGQRFGKDRRWAVRLKATAPGITASLGAVASQGLGKGSPQGSLIAADSKNVWNLVLNAPASITEAAGVNVSQGNLTGTLVNALQNAWTLDINSTAAYSTFTEVVQLSGRRNWTVTLANATSVPTPQGASVTINTVVFPEIPVEPEKNATDDASADSDDKVYVPSAELHQDRQQCADGGWYACSDTNCTGVRACASNESLLDCACPVEDDETDTISTANTTNTTNTTNTMNTTNTTNGADTEIDSPNVITTMIGVGTLARAATLGAKTVFVTAPLALNLTAVVETLHRVVLPDGPASGIDIVEAIPTTWTPNANGTVVSEWLPDTPSVQLVINCVVGTIFDSVNDLVLTGDGNRIVSVNRATHSGATTSVTVLAASGVRWQDFDADLVIGGSAVSGTKGIVSSERIGNEPIKLIMPGFVELTTATENLYIDGYLVNAEDIDLVELDNEDVSSCFTTFPGTGAACNRGTYVPESGGVCRDCDIGYYRDNVLTFACDPCELGKISQLPGSLRCENCEAGSFIDELGQYACKKCQPGMYNSSVSGVVVTALLCCLSSSSSLSS